MKLYGIYYKAIYRNLKSGYTIFIIKDPENKKGNQTCAGYIPVYTSQMPLMLTGEMEDTKWGKTFRVDISKEYIQDEKTAVSFLGGLVKGISVATAKRIVEKYGYDLFSFAERENAEELLAEIPRIDEDKAKALIERIKKEKNSGELFQYLRTCNVPYTAVDKLIKEFGGDAVRQLKQNPYRVGQLAGLSFYTCDLIARRERIDPLDKNRINAIIYEAMLNQLQNGHCYVTMKQLKTAISYVLKSAAYPDSIPESLVGIVLQTNKTYVLEMSNPIHIYLKFIWQQEIQTANQIKRLLASKQKLPFTDKLIHITEEECGVQYAEGQKCAFSILQSSGVKILTGGPGTGKTTVVNGLIHVYEKMLPENEIVLCAPTGRAAQRMAETTGRKAYTIHKLLNIRPFEKEIMSKDHSDPIRADFIIVDEFSMVDITLMSILLDAVQNGTLLLLVGDENQLPSVGPGAVMRDLLESRVIECYKLKTIFRQKGTSSIIKNAWKVLEGKTDFEKDEDFEVKEVISDEELKETALEYVKGQYKKDDPFHLQVLTPIKAGVTGIYELNQNLQEIVNGEGKSLKYGTQSFHVGDKIIMTRNNYITGYYNGDIGQIEEICENGVINQIQKEELGIFNEDLEDMMLAYAMTIHKSQGSEYDMVLVLVPENKSGLSRNGLFTALTRAKKKVILLYTPKGLEAAVNNTKAFWRNTNLKNRLLGKAFDVIPKIEYGVSSIF